MGMLLRSILLMNLQREAFPSLATGLFIPIQSVSNHQPIGTTIALVSVLVLLMDVPLSLLQNSHGTPLWGLLQLPLTRSFIVPCIQVAMSSGFGALEGLQERAGQEFMPHHALLLPQLPAMVTYLPNTWVVTTMLSVLQLDPTLHLFKSSPLLSRNTLMPHPNN